VFTPVSRTRASADIVDQIERAIFDGAYSAGERLRSERELAEQFKVSRITVRDALRVLEARGLIRVKVGASGGAFVTDTNLDQVVGSISTMVKLQRMTLSELAEARTIVETAAAERAAARADANAIARLVEMVKRSSDVVRDGLPHTEVSMDFHVAVAEASGNELLSATVRAYRDLLMQTLRDMRDPSSALVTQKWHEDILDAIRQHDAEATGKLMQEHLLDFERRIRTYLQSQPDGRGASKAPPRSARIDRVPAPRGNGR
jgi:GntR family transcriptional repressor for pyruvate dehydrogenase complex